MARMQLFLSLAACLATLLSSVCAIEIYDIFTVDRTADVDGGCRSRLGVLDEWLSECIESIDIALSAIDDYRNDIRVRRSMSIFFGIHNSGRNQPESVGQVRAEIRFLAEFFNQAEKEVDPTGPIYPPSQFWLFCDSTFLSLREPGDPAQDFQGNEIVDEDGSAVSISDVPAYKKSLGEDQGNKPWWSGDLTDLQGYYFTDHGGNYCYDDELGITASIQLLGRPELASIILCPYAFDRSPKPDNYRAANNLLADGVNLADAIPKSTTLLHEAFHFLRGDEFLSGDDEKYDIASCINMAASHKRHNPETYVFFIAHMYHMRAIPEDSEPWSIPRNWDFHNAGQGSRRIFSAFATTQATG
ncbi:hypothetical protein B0I35DRAFT_61850 [Stachybotrys elegans]|uniref:Lysine-specific metallo-endopeptidase domain-containing protein n=1 Tax=Stachybotrys elegans TaxID=80388 RepID=A0A8K0SP46_9HYPO|nr:hypothetical protein B0I35DRAFT_61850 [Stachybotrys elegans]